MSYAFVFIIKCSLASYVILAIMLIVSMFWGGGNKKLLRWLTLAFIIFYVLMAFAFGFNNDIFIDKFYWIFLSLFLLPLQVLSFTIVIITKIILICIIKPKT